MPGQAFRVDNQIVRARTATAARSRPYVPGDSPRRPGSGSPSRPWPLAAGRAFAAIAAQTVPDVRIADYANTHNRAFLTRDGRTTFALAFTAPTAGFGGNSLGPAIQRTLAAAVPAVHVGAHRRAVADRTASPPRSKGTGVMAEAMIGAVGALAILAAVFGSFLAVLPLLIGGSRCWPRSCWSVG